MKIKLGNLGQKIAKDYLETKGYQILEENYQVRAGEIDLVAKENQELVFVEVKTRTSLSFGQPEEAISAIKKEHFKKAIESYVQAIDWSGDFRADCLFIFIDRKDHQARFKHLKAVML